MFPRPPGPTVKRRTRLTLCSPSMSQPCPRLSTGAMSMALTSAHGTRTSTLLATAAPAGLWAQPQLLLIASTSTTTSTTLMPTPLLVFLPRMLSTSSTVVHAMVETPLESTRLPMMSVLCTHLASNMLPSTCSTPPMP